ncbi:hypothetical protein [Paraburkholderia solitsugae]|uniref:hypothetical protein n=1 Tax=Paraburkholderia solitsugae TaxID=2675748 RepID=UPI001555C2DE|nr:hypothetical protein [Paraburkholderia solitsugae]
MQAAELPSTEQAHSQNANTEWHDITRHLKRKVAHAAIWGAHRSPSTLLVAANCAEMLYDGHHEEFANQSESR